MTAKTRILLTSFYCLVIGSLQVNYLHANELTEVHLGLHWNHQFQFAGYYAAIHKGFYKEVGLNVQLVERSTIKEVANGTIHFGVENARLLTKRADGLPIVILNPIFQHSPRIIIGSVDRGVESVHDLVGKKVMMSTDEAYVQRYFIKEGVDINAIDIVPRDTLYKAFINGEADATMAYSTNTPFLLKKLGFPFSIISPITGGIDFYSDILYTNENMVLNNFELVEAMQAASLKGWQYAMDNKEEIIDIICEHYQNNCDREALVFEANESENLITPNLMQIGYSNPGRWRFMINEFKEAGLIDASFSSEGLFLEDYLNHKSIPWLLIIIVLLVVVPLIFAVVIFYRIIKKLRSQINLNEKLASNLSIGQKKYKNFIDNTNDIIYSLDLNGRILYVSRNVEESIGYTVNELIGNRIYSFIHIDDVKHSIERIKDIYENGNKNKAIYFRIITKDGTWRSFLTNMYAVTDVNGNISHVDGMSVDITDRIEYEETISRQKTEAEDLLKSYQDIVDNNTVYIVKMTEKLDLLYVNPCYAAIYGVAQEDFVGKSATMFVTEEMAKEMFSVATACTKSPNESKELIIETNAGSGYTRSTKWEVKATQKLEDGLWELLAVGFDITDQMDNLKQSAELLEKSKAQNLKLQTFGFVVSHNIRSQAANMAGLLGLLDIAESREEVNSTRLLMKASSKKLDETLGHLNGLLEIEYATELSYQSVNLFLALQDAKRAWSKEDLQTNREIIINVSDELRIYVNPAYLYSILYNIYKYIKEFIREEIDGSPIVIAAEEIGKGTINVRVQYQPNDRDLVHKGVHTFNPLKSRLGNQSALSMGMFLMHEQLATMDINYELKLIKKNPSLAEFSLNFTKGD